jgi:hypothetical protein
MKHPFVAEFGLIDKEFNLGGQFLSCQPSPSPAGVAIYFSLVKNEGEV